MSFRSSSSDHSKRRMTKTEKIAELIGKLKLVQDENKRLQEEAEAIRGSEGLGNGSSDHKSVSTKERDKLKEALRTLKRVTVKQEVSLATLRQKSKQRRQEIEQKNKIIKKLELDNQAFRKAHERMKAQSNDGDDVATLKAKLADLQLRLANEETSKKEQSEILKEREAGINSLQAMLASAKGRGVARTHSSDSGQMSMMSDSTAGEDIAKLKKELARRSEKITNLQHELDVCKDEIHDLKQRNKFTNAFPTTPAPGELDFFEGDGEGDDFWTAF
mmetsp:Transcript_14921/g.30935  ORF Transcript_14921/g.30935 Transcript_14921/m.30935 type:complete len:275 (-) Transcript_14921:1423-2247(-)|eukprot:CAMPEP_0197278916 /NCGR_PEP_ID=MMETSP1432-20130617/19287_1 /TAXON_ID=44447 /ORGANISM="Pseudo-nitzschia delicatissima, Strain UNC1205" /LENGTH=274 /DNA_ID=CAMNT_0042745357 /DNA_START=129 /DNA_END=953 /DNA_ORIENTATION=-